MRKLRTASENPRLRLQAQAPQWLVTPFRHEVQAARSDPWLGGPRLYESAARELHYRSILQNAVIARFLPAGDERCPFLYRPLVEFVLALPWEHLLTPAEDRVIQRRALRAILPDAIRRRTSKASGTPQLLRGLRRNWMRVRRFIAAPRLASLGLVEPTLLQDACEGMRHGLLGAHLPDLVAALSMEMWLDANESYEADSAVADHFARREPDAQQRAATLA